MTAKHSETENLKRKELFSRPPAVENSFWEKALDWAAGKVKDNIPVFKNSYPAPASINNVYPLIDNNYWTTSFWPGMLWLAWEITGENVFRETAEARIADFRSRLEKRIEVETHDLGFLYTLSCVAPWKLTGSELAKESAIKAADLLMKRYFEKAGIIQAWGDLNDPGQRGRIIIDCSMNLPLLYWASKETGSPHYKEAAEQHMRQANRYLIRDNWSSYHTFFFDTESGSPVRGNTAQGYSDDSCWARGQAWGIYGNALSYKYVRDREFTEYARGLALYFLNRLPEDLIAYWDLVFTNGNEERDSSAAAIAACGLLELSAALPHTDPDHLLFKNAALHIMASLASSYTSSAIPGSNGLLLHGVYSKPDKKGVDECTCWGDYFYLEALVRIAKSWNIYW